MANYYVSIDGGNVSTVAAESKLDAAKISAVTEAWSNRPGYCQKAALLSVCELESIKEVASYFYFDSIIVTEKA